MLENMECTERGFQNLVPLISIKEKGSAWCFTPNFFNTNFPLLKREGSRGAWAVQLVKTQILVWLTSDPWL